jgi:hypothetical protein
MSYSSGSFFLKATSKNFAGHVLIENNILQALGLVYLTTIFVYVC